MNYILINNNDFYISNEIKTYKVEKGPNYKHAFDLIDIASVCVVDVDVMIAAAPENQIEKKDNILIRKFGELYQEKQFIVQDEKIDNNLFQVIGIKSDVLRSIYSLIPSHKVSRLVPYALAIRNLLHDNKKIISKPVVFVDVLNDEKFITVFDGYRFSRTRLVDSPLLENLMPEIKRSHIDFNKKNEEFVAKASSDFVIITNSQVLANGIKEFDPTQKIESLDIPVPSIEGLKTLETTVNYRLPEEIIKKRKESDLRKQISVFAMSFLILGIGLAYFIFNKIENTLLNAEYSVEAQKNVNNENKLSALDKETYREVLKEQKSLNYAISYLKLLHLVPVSYDIPSFKFYGIGEWNLEAYLLTKEDESLDEIPRVKFLKSAVIKNYYIKNKPGKYLQIKL